MKFFIPLLILLFSCSSKPVSTGAPGEIIVYTSDADKKIVFQHINELFDDWLQLVDVLGGVDVDFFSDVHPPMNNKTIVNVFMIINSPFNYFGVSGYLHPP